MAEIVAGTTADQIGVPLGFTLPDEWQPVDPAIAGVAGAALVAVRPTEQGFTPHIIVGVTRRTDDTAITTIADAAIGRLRAIADEITLTARTTLGGPTTPGVAQVLRVRVRTGESGPPRPLVQSQVHLTIPLGDTLADRLIVELVCTCDPAQLGRVNADFQRFVGSLHVRTGVGTGSGTGRK